MNKNISKTVWETDLGRKKFLKRSKHELENANKQFKERKESVQIRVSKWAYKQVKFYAQLSKKTIANVASQIINSTLSHHDSEIKAHDKKCDAEIVELMSEVNKK